MSRRGLFFATAAVFLLSTVTFAANKAEKRHGLRPPASAAEAQRNLDAATTSGHVGQLLQHRAREEQVSQEIRNEWPLAPEFMREWKNGLIGDAYDASSGWVHAERMNDQQLEKLRRSFNIPKDEEIYAYHEQNDSEGVVTDDSGFAMVATDKAIHLHLLIRGATTGPNNERCVDCIRHAADPIGLFHVSHAAILATDSFTYNARVLPYSDKYTENDSHNCINVFGAWMVDGRPVLDFGKTEGPGDCRRGNNGELVPAPDYNYRHLQIFLAKVLKCDADFAIKAARERHLAEPNEIESGTSTTTGDLLTGYLGTPWGSSFKDVNRKFAAKGAPGYGERLTFRLRSRVEC